MTTKDEALQMALGALAVATTPLAEDRQRVLKAIAACRAAIAQKDEQEPVAGLVLCNEGRCHCSSASHSASIKGSNQAEGTRAFRRAQKEARHAI